MIPTPARDDLFLFWTSQNVVIVPDHLDIGFIGIRTRQAKIDFRHVFRCAIQYHFGQRDRSLGSVTNIGVVIGQLLGLCRNRLGNLGPAVTDIDTIKPGKGIQKATAVTVLNIHPATTRHNPVGHITTGKFRQMRRGMEEILAIPLVQMVVVQHIYSNQIHLLFKETKLKFAISMVGYFQGAV